MRVVDLIEAALADRGDASVRDLVAAVRAAGGHGVSRAAVERILVADPRFASTGDAGKARWTLAEDGSVAGDGADCPDESDEVPRGRSGGSSVAEDGADRPDESDEVPRGPAGTPPQPATPPQQPTTRSRQASRARLDALELRPWQAEALADWSQTCRGVVEAVTGTGKTMLAIAAAGLALERGARVLVLVPTLELQQQWSVEVRRHLPGVRVGRLGGGGDDDLFSSHVLVATPQSAADVPIDLPPDTAGLVVADEAHRYGAPTWAAALPDDFDLRLALTATYERSDDGVDDVLTPYFGEVVHRYGYDRAVGEGTVAPFRIAIATVALSEAERAGHDAADARARRLHRELIGPLGMPREPRALLAAAAAVVADAGPGPDGPQARACREYLLRLRERRAVAARAAAKLDVVDAVAPALAGGRSLVFTDTVDQADDATARLRRAGRDAVTIHGELTGRQRRGRLVAFRRGDVEVVVAPRVLDEGVDVPDADIAVVLAAFRSRRQSVQRLGRVLRRKPDGREARLVLAAAADTAEDPARGGHGAFLGQVRAVARSIDHLDVADDPAGLARWLRTAAG